MKRLLFILLLAAGTAHGQINNPPTSVNIVDSTATGRAVLTATNAAAAATAISLGTTNDVTFNRVATTASGNLDNLAIRIGATNTGLNSVAGFLFGVSKGEYVFGVGPTGFSVTPPATFITNVNVNGSLVGTGPATFATNVTVNGALTVGSLATTTPSTWALDATQTASTGPTTFGLALPDNANVIRLTNNYPIRQVSNGRLGAFYYVINQSGSSLAIDHTNGITVQGGKSLTLANNESATLVATGATNVSVANRGDLTDVALGGTANTAPSQTASSGSSLMTRDLGDTRYGNMQFLKMATNISSVTDFGPSATTSAESVTLVAGTYEITLQMFGLCNSATAGITVGLSDDASAANGTGTFIGTLYVSDTHDDGAGNGVVLGPAFGGVVRNASENFAFAFTDSASRRTLYYGGTGFLTLTATRTFKFKVLQRHAADASNPAVLQANLSFAVFRRIY